MLRSGKELNELEAKQKIKEKVLKEEKSNKVQQSDEDVVILGRIHILDNPSPYMPPIPYPQRLQKAKLDK